MDERNEANGNEQVGLQTEQQPGPMKKRPYQVPRIVESGVFEHLVLACGHTAGDLSCRFSPMGQTS